jgi:hypothetical protein
MTKIHDFVEEWIEIRSKLKRQLEVLDQGEEVLGSMTETTKMRIRTWIEELNALLKENASGDRT